ncbi:hypothetical protein ACWD4N_22900 [Streptomyces sp. NPDC002586]
MSLPSLYGRHFDTRTYVAAFFDLYLRGVAEPLLNGPTSAYPEVGFHTP